MTILVAPDKFKGSLSAHQVCDALKEGLLHMDSSLNIVSVPMADGGEGTCDLLTDFHKGKKVEVEVHDPQFEVIKSHYGISKDSTTAFIEMANASGLQLVNPKRKNPLYTTTYGTGELILDALTQGVKKIIMGIGGSGTTDGGMGMAEALGYEFHDVKGKKLKPVGENLILIDSIKPIHVHPRIKDVDFLALCDVDNPLFGPYGAAFTYSPQKGADEVAVKLLDEGLKNFENVVLKTFGLSSNFPGAGAGGGLAGGAKVFLNMQINRGMDFILETTHLADQINNADLIITGEGKVDQQTFAGKVVMEVAKLALRFRKPAFVICGVCELNSEDLQKMGISKVISLVDEFTPAEEAQRNAYLLIKQRMAVAYHTLI